MRVLHVLVALIVSGSFFSGAIARAEKNDDNDKVTLTINATCEANSTTNTGDAFLKEKLTGTLKERATYRIVSSEGGRLELELIDQKNSIVISGGGTYKSPIESASWTLNTGNPAIPRVQGSVGINTMQGTGNINVSNFMQQAKIKASPEDGPGGRLAVDMAEMVIDAANSIPSGIFFESNENFLKGLDFTFDPKSKHIASSGQANYRASFKDESGNIASTGSLSVSYTVNSGVPEELRAVLIPKGDYHKWLPRAKAKGPDTPGNSITFDVELRNPEGGKVKEKTAQFEIELLDTSRHLGAAMNSPWTGVDPDLKILKVNNPTLVEISADGQKAKTAKGLKSSPITISSLDGAAMGKLTVLARIDGEDTVLTAHLENDQELTEVNLPYDSDGNTIADAWEEENDTMGKLLNTDEDAEPPGDRHNGDGLTIWEEYRGFMEDGKHIRTNPRKKDFFLCDTLGGKSKRAINRFAALTKLDVHDKLTLDELSASRIINRNQGEDATHVVDQHGIVLDSWHTKGLCKAKGGPGTPKSIDRVLIASTLKETLTIKISGGATKTYPYYEITVAHELLHCCNVWHHGQGDKGKLWWHEETVAGVTDIYEYAAKTDCGHPERGTKIKTLRENGIDSFGSDWWTTPTRIWMGEQQGQHSGNEDCVMRYDVSQAYRGSGNDRYYLIWENEPVGQGLCVSPTGTGVNEAGRKPRARYGDAAAGRGNCTDHICVNDLYH